MPKGIDHLAGKGTRRITPRIIAQWAIASNADVLYSKIGMESAKFKKEAERGLYEPIWFSNLQHTNTERKRTEEERFVADFLPLGDPEIHDRANSLETGIRFPLPSGGELSMSYEFSERTNSLYDSEGNHEYTGALNLKLQQPLLRDAGKEFTETAMRIKKLEYGISELKYKKVVLETAGQAGQLYWQLYRAYEVWKIRVAALHNGERLLDDLKVRVVRGQAARISLAEAQVSISDRKAQVARALQTLIEVIARIKTLLNVGDNAGINELAPDQQPTIDEENAKTLEERLRGAYAVLPDLQITEKQYQEEMLRLNYARNQSRIRLDLVGGYGLDSLGYDYSETLSDSVATRYQDWFVGLKSEMPLYGSRRAKNEERAQAAVLKQVVLERQALANRVRIEINGRLEQLQQTYDEVHEVASSMHLDEELLKVEQEMFQRGKTRLRDVLERENELISMRQRMIETAARVEIARIALMVADGSLLDEYAIHVAP